MKPKKPVHTKKVASKKAASKENPAPIIGKVRATPPKPKQEPVADKQPEPVRESLTSLAASLLSQA